MQKIILVFNSKLQNECTAHALLHSDNKQWTIGFSKAPRRVNDNPTLNENSSNMAQTVISAKYPPQIDPTRTPLAYGDRALPRLVSRNCRIVLLIKVVGPMQFVNIRVRLQPFSDSFVGIYLLTIDNVLCVHCFN